MSTRAEARPGTGRGTGWVIGAVIVALLAALWFFGRAERPLEDSAVGFAGLVAWLDGNGVEARTFTGGGYLVEGTVGLRILPLHDTDLSAGRVPPETPEALVEQTSERDLDLDVLAAKMALLPTLVILPKWRSGVRVLGAAHRDLLVPGAELAELVDQIPRLRGRIVRDASGYAETAGPGGRPVGLFHAQALAGGGCEPLIGTREAMLLGRCPLDRPGSERPARPRHFWLLADPDLMNNHGLTLAGNAGVALDVVRGAAGDGPVVLDLTDWVATVDADWQDRRERGWEDLARLFEWPFAVLWLAFGALAALVLWRAIVRYGPVVAAEDEERMRASRAVSIDAKARLLRLADHDVALMRLHVAHRLQQLAAELLGPHRSAGTEPLALLTGIVGRRSPGLAQELAEAARLPDERRGRPGELLRRLDRFEDCIHRIRDEFGRAAGARG